MTGRSGAAQALYGAKSRSLPQKLVMQLFSWGAVAAAAWFMLGGGREALAARCHVRWQPAVPLRAELLVGCSAIYAARLVFTQLYLVRRRMAWSEAATIAAWLWVIHGTMAFLGGRNPARVGIAVWLGLALYLLGSFLNTGSELLRDHWKKRPENKGRLYTGGLFRYSMHVNYFGDVVLFSGFALVTGSAYAFVIPALMACMFIFVNIPMLDAYLASHYGAQFDEYARRTAKLIPFIY
jgi:protein-S-isoprenylcysteine O-methyltransferase Ste14